MLAGALVSLAGPERWARWFEAEMIFLLGWYHGALRDVPS
jgi:hypothetical protein